MANSTITLRKKDFVFLAALLGEKVVFGIEDPFSGWLAEQVLDEWNITAPRLMRDGYLYLDQDGVFKVESNMREIVLNCCLPNFWISVETFELDSSKTTKVLNYSSEGLRVVIISSTNDDELVEINSKEIVINIESEVVDLIPFKNLDNTKEINYYMSEVDFNRLKYENESQEESITQLSIELISLRKVLKNPDTKMIINMGIVNFANLTFQSFGIIQNETSEWSIEYQIDELTNIKMVMIKNECKINMIQKLNLMLKEIQTESYYK